MSNDTQLTKFQRPAELMKYLESGKGAVAMALPKHLNPDRMLRLAVTCFSTTPALRNCTGQSILASIVVASQLGLEPGVAGQAYLIPYGNTCTLVPGWQGLVSLLNNSGRATAWTGAVFEGDVFDFQLGSAPRCVHIPGDNFGDPEKITWVYACGKVNGSEQPVIEAWPMSRVWKHRDRFNKVGQKHYSYQHPEMYARKVVLLQVLKYMPRSIELNNAMTAAHAAEEGRSSKVEDGVVIDVPTSTVTEVEAPPSRRSTEDQSNQNPKADPPTPLQKLERLAKAAGVTDAQILAWVNSQRAANADPENRHEFRSVSETHENIVKHLVAGWVDILPQIKGESEPQGAPAGDGNETTEIPSDPAALVKFVRQQVADRDLNESDVVAFLKAKHKCGAGCKTLTDVAQSGLRWMAENIGTVKDEIGNAA